MKQHDEIHREIIEQTWDQPQRQLRNQLVAPIGDATVDQFLGRITSSAVERIYEQISLKVNDRTHERVFVHVEDQIIQETGGLK